LLNRRGTKEDFPVLCPGFGGFHASDSKTKAVQGKPFRHAGQSKKRIIVADDNSFRPEEIGISLKEEFLPVDTREP
jgi:hypothetical protein